MPTSDSNVIFRLDILLRITPSQAREFIFTPARILDYSPTHNEGGVLIPGSAIYCRGDDSMFVMERISPADDVDCVVVEVHSAQALLPPHSIEQVKEAAIFRMVEDWQLAATPEGTLLTKTWRDLEQFKFPEFPMGPIVRATAEEETSLLVEGWNRAALS